MDSPLTRRDPSCFPDALVHCQAFHGGLGQVQLAQTCAFFNQIFQMSWSKPRISWYVAMALVQRSAVC